MRAYCHVIEIFIESSALLTISLILYIVVYALYSWTLYYFTVFATIARVWSY